MLKTTSYEILYLLLREQLEEQKAKNKDIQQKALSVHENEIRALKNDRCP